MFQVKVHSSMKTCEVIGIMLEKAQMKADSNKTNQIRELFLLHNDGKWFSIKECCLNNQCHSLLVLIWLSLNDKHDYHKVWAWIILADISSYYYSSLYLCTFINDYIIPFNIFCMRFLSFLLKSTCYFKSTVQYEWKFFCPVSFYSDRMYWGIYVLSV